jgi:hypothetical protein
MRLLGRASATNPTPLILLPRMARRSVSGGRTSAVLLNSQLRRDLSEHHGPHHVNKTLAQTNKTDNPAVA